MISKLFVAFICVHIVIPKEFWESSGSDELPDYVVADVNNLEAVENTPLRILADYLYFPLSWEDKRDLEILEKKFDSETDMAGLAAPQIGISKRVIIFKVDNDSKLKRVRKDLSQYFPKTLWINPTYDPIGTEMHVDFESCFSVKDVGAKVKRYKQITYRAFNNAGELVTGKAEGYAARVIQHEVDHLDGKLFVDLVPKSELLLREGAKEEV